MLKSLQLSFSKEIDKIEKSTSLLYSESKEKMLRKITTQASGGVEPVAKNFAKEKGVTLIRMGMVANFVTIVYPMILVNHSNGQQKELMGTVAYVKKDYQRRNR